MRSTTDSATCPVLNTTCQEASPQGWCNALAYCEGLNLAGHDDWRLPNLRELQSIVDYGRVDPSIDPVFGPLSLRYLFWSSTPVAGNLGYAWLTEFRYGNAHFLGETFSGYYVRAVRRGP
jgi:hypothetical protein